MYTIYKNLHQVHDSLAARPSGGAGARRGGDERGGPHRLSPGASLMRTRMGWNTGDMVPPPRHRSHTLRPDPRQVGQLAESPSLHRVHRHSLNPDPPHPTHASKPSSPRAEGGAPDDAPDGPVINAYAASAAALASSRPTCSELGAAVGSNPRTLTPSTPVARLLAPASMPKTPLPGLPAVAGTAARPRIGRPPRPWTPTTAPNDTPATRHPTIVCFRHPSPAQQPTLTLTHSLNQSINQSIN